MSKKTKKDQDALKILIKTRQIEDLAPYARKVIENEIFRYQFTLDYEKAKEAQLHPEGRVCTHKDCEKAGEVQPCSDFYKSKKSPSGYSSWCKECSKRVNRAYRKKNNKGHGRFKGPGRGWTTYL